VKKLMEKGRLRRLKKYDREGNALSSKVCPKCNSLMERKGSRFDHTLAVKTGVIGAKRPAMYVCEKCGYLEFYLE